MKQEQHSKKLSDKTRLLLATLALLALAGLFVFLYVRFRPGKTEGQKTITVTVTHSDGSSKSDTITTDADTLREACEGTLSLEGEEGMYGLYVKVVDGERADYDEDYAYWAIYDCGSYSDYGVDSLMIVDGGEYEFVYTSVR